ncbi:MAG: hypothetical protein OXI75_10040 [Rhodospirillales bacterium]|nr:hypothetical protein [Rhodospirillales bacterium]
MGGGGDDSSGITMKDYVDAQIDKAIAQSDARFTDVMAELRSLRERSLSWRGMWSAVALSTATLIGIILAALSIAGDRFDGGLAARGLLDPIVVRQEERDNAQDETLGQILAIVEQLRDDVQTGAPDEKD